MYPKLDMNVTQKIPKYFWNSAVTIGFRPDPLHGVKTRISWKITRFITKISGF